MNDLSTNIAITENIKNEFSLYSWQEYDYKEEKFTDMYFTEELIMRGKYRYIFQNQWKKILRTYDIRHISSEDKKRFREINPLIFFNYIILPKTFNPIIKEIFINDKGKIINHKKFIEKKKEEDNKNRIRRKNWKNWYFMKITQIIFKESIISYLDQNKHLKYKLQDDIDKLLIIRDTTKRSDKKYYKINTDLNEMYKELNHQEVEVMKGLALFKELNTNTIGISFDDAVENLMNTALNNDLDGKIFSKTRVK